ncbi:hypothetical protein BKA66DRAFT_392120, partial [Pyrenochaeta sp. MPI-SDFR-AT-0127]
WEILNGDTRDPVLVGVPQPQRLTLSFRHTTTGETSGPLVYKKPADQIGWDNIAEIKKINSWRTQIFNRKKFPPKVEKTSWTPDEVAYLELLHEKVKIAAKNNTLQRPNNARILEEFNRFFHTPEDRKDGSGDFLQRRPARDLNQISTKMNRSNTRIRKLRDDLQNLPKTSTDTAYMPTITQDEINNYLRDGTVNDTYLPHSPPKADRQSSRANLSTSFGVQGDLAPGDDNSSPSSTSSSSSDSVISTPNDSERRQNASPKNSAVHITSPEELEKRKSEGWEIPDFPKNNEEALRRHRELAVNSPQNISWHKQAIEDLDSRIDSSSSCIAKGRVNRESWFRDRPDIPNHPDAIKHELWHKESLRKPGAAAVNGLLGAAIIPPFGYRGPIRDLVTKKLLPADELLTAEKSAEAMEK